MQKLNYGRDDKVYAPASLECLRLIGIKEVNEEIYNLLTRVLQYDTASYASVKDAMKISGKRVRRQ